MNLALVWRARHGRSGSRPKVTLIDIRAEEIVEELQRLYPSLHQYCDLDPCQMDLRSGGFKTQFLPSATPWRGVTAAYVCVGDDSLCLFTGLALARHLRPHGVRVVTRLAEDSGFASLIRTLSDSGDWDDLQPFFLDRSHTVDLQPNSLEALAQATHQAYLAMCREQGRISEESLSTRPWAELPPDLKASNYAQARHTGRKLQAISCTVTTLLDWDAEPFEFTPGEIEELARLEHERYVEERLRAGRSMGVRAARRKANPTFVPWADLPEEVKEFNRGLIRNIPRCLAAQGFRIHRLKGVTPR